MSLLKKAVVVQELAEKCCGEDTGTTREPDERERPSLEAVTGGLVRTQWT
jgi:hypothetical protein